MPVVTASCNPSGESTISITRGMPLSGYYQHLEATIGPQTLDPRPAFQPFPNDGMRVESIGFDVGPVTSLQASFETVLPPDGRVVTGTQQLLSPTATTASAVSSTTR